MKICDCHNDFLTEIKGNKNLTNYIQLINKNNHIKYICSQVWTTKISDPLRYISNIKNNKDLLSNEKFILCIEDLGFISKDNYYKAIEEIIKIKPFSCGLVWNYDNNLGGGAFGKLGLTNLGIKVVTELERNNIVIDTAHMNRRTFYDFSKITSQPIYNSHTNIDVLYKHKRNLNNLQIKTCIHSKGLIALSFVQTFVNDKSIDAYYVAKQIEFFARNFGTKNISIGTDYFGTKNLPIDLRNYENFINLKTKLKMLKISKKDINRISYKNFYDFYKKTKKRLV